MPTLWNWEVSLEILMTPTHKTWVTQNNIYIYNYVSIVVDKRNQRPTF